MILSIQFCFVEIEYCFLNSIEDTWSHVLYLKGQNVVCALHIARSINMAIRIIC